MTDLKEEKIVETLQKSPLTGYYIAQKTGLTVQSIINYRKKTTVPTRANIKLLEYFFKDENNARIAENSIKASIINGSNVQTGANSSIDARQYYSDSPDVLRAQIDALDTRIKEKDAQIKEKDAQINKLLNIMSK